VNAFSSAVASPNLRILVQVSSNRPAQQRGRALGVQSAAQSAGLRLSIVPVLLGVAAPLGGALYDHIASASALLSWRLASLTGSGLNTLHAPASLLSSKTARASMACGRLPDVPSMAANRRTKWRTLIGANAVTRHDHPSSRSLVRALATHHAICRREAGAARLPRVANR
jgi:hypothetical protein